LVRPQILPDGFARILKPGGWTVLVWNDRKTQSSRFLVEYEKLLRNYATVYAKVDHKNIDDKVVREFFSYTPAKKLLPSSQGFDYEGLKGRLFLILRAGTRPAASLGNDPRPRRTFQRAPAIRPRAIHLRCRRVLRKV
jgi:hypothetical protein